MKAFTFGAAALVGRRLLCAFCLVLWGVLWALPLVCVKQASSPSGALVKSGSRAALALLLLLVFAVMLFCGEAGAGFKLRPAGALIGRRLLLPAWLDDALPMAGTLAVPAFTRWHHTIQNK